MQHGTQKGKYLERKLWFWDHGLTLSSSLSLSLSLPLGDVYSFAIIAHEIILRQGIFYLGEKVDHTPRGTLTLFDLILFTVLLLLQFQK